jgi:hypothetical protein
MKKAFTFLFFLILTNVLVNAQISINVVIKNPTPSNLSEWQTDPSNVQIIINNYSSQSYPNSYISFSIVNDKNISVARTDEKDNSLPRINIPPGPSTNVFNGTQIFNLNAVTFDQSIRNIATNTNSIPEGNYQFCVKLFDQYGKELSSTGEVCTNFFIMIPDPPTLISPVNDDIIISPNPNFVWSPVTNIPPGMIISYKIKICPIFNGQSPRTAIESNQVLLEKDNIKNTSYQYLPSDLPFNYFPNAIGYAWIVQAFNQFGVPASRNDGKSEIGTFKLKQEELSTIELLPVYPVDNDTLPWNPPHLIVKYNPYRDDIRSIKFTLRFRKEGNNVEQTFTRQINFPSGPMNSQGLSSQEKATYIFVNVDSMKNIVDFMRNLEEGKKYIWSLRAEFVKSDGSIITSNTNTSSFVIGFKKPMLKLANDTIVTVSKDFNIVWNIPKPSKLNFDQLDLLQVNSFHAFGSSTNGKGLFEVEFSRKNSFDSIYLTKKFQIPSSLNYSTGNSCDSLFSDISRKFSISDTGAFFWRLKYLSSSNLVYLTSETRKIKVQPITSISCFDMRVQIPENNSTITDTKPKFSVSIKPQIRKNSITGGNIKIWKMDSRSQLVSEVKTSKPILDSTFTGNDNSKLFAYTPDFDGYTRYDLNFINTDSNSISFSADTSNHYLWNFTLNYKKDSIRADGVHCDSNCVTSNDGIFSVSRELASDTSSCTGNCIVPAPTNTTISTVTYAKDSVIKIGQFDLKLTSVSGSASSLSGEGEIKVPALQLRAPILVEFNGLKVNTDNVVFEGEAYAKISEGAGYSLAEGNDFTGQVLNMANDKIKSIHDKLESKGLYVSAFTNTNAVGLPIGFDKVVKGHRVVIAIIGMKFTPTQAVLNATSYVEFPKLGPGVGFGLGAKNICFHKNGFSTSGQGTLYLAQDFGYRNEGTWSILFKAPTPSDRGTYMSWDCHGFKEFVVSAEVEFPRTWLKPLSTTDTTKLAKAVFNTKAEKSGNGWQWLASANLEECEITSLPGFKISVQDMVFDFSSERNPETISFPKNYSGSTNNSWEGFFIRKATLILPDKLKTFENENPSILVNNLIIDRTGFTSYIEAANIIQHPKGNFGKLGGSLDSIKLSIVSSSYQNGMLKGRINLSFIDTSLTYIGTLAKSSDSKGLVYQFLIVPADTIEISCGGKIKLDPSSRIELFDTSGTFVAQALLNGTYTLEGSLGNLSQLGLSGIVFEELGLSTESPYVRLKNCNFASPQHSIAGFPITINNVEPLFGTRSGMPAAGLKFTVGLNLQPGANAISGSTTLSLWAKLGSDYGPQKFIFDGVKLDAISLNADLGAVKINGSINIYNNNSVYGNGFRGALSAMFVDQFSVTATAQFGTVNNFRYWYVDAKALFNTGLQILPGVGLYGFGGGAWYHMRKSGETNLSTPASSPDNSSNPGTTNSGFTYVPDNNINFGFKGTAILGTYPSPEAFNGDLSLEAEFLNNGGIGRISVTGPAYMLCNITNRSSAKVTANVNMDYNVPTKTFDGIFDVRINASPFTGGGQMILHFSPDLWFVKIGEPSNRINLKLADWLTGGGYLMCGMNLPPPPQLPTEIQNLFPEFTTTPRNQLIQQGKSFAFGESIDLNTGRKEYLNFYGSARFLGGFDLVLANYGQNTTCEGMSGSIGVNGWYAMGQIYAYVNAVIGLHVDVSFYEGDVQILNLSVGSALQGGGPKPTWIKGIVGGPYSIFNGKIKGYCNFEFKLGDECVPVIETPLSKIDLISDINPQNGQSNIDVFIEPQVATNFKLDTPFELEELSGQSQNSRIRVFKINLKPLTLTNLSNNQNVSGSNVVSQDKYSTFFSFNDALLSNTRYKFSAIAYGEELISGTWQPARKKDGSLVEQRVESIFTTSNAPDNIPNNNVEYTYPFNGHKYFLQNECRKGLIQLKRGQSDLFTPKEGYKLDLIARFVPIDLNSQTIDVPFVYNNSSKQISFNIPILQNNKGYYLQLIKKESKISSTGLAPGIGSINQFLTMREKVLLSKNSSSIYFEQPSISSSKVKPGEKLLFVFFFGTSRYNTLQEKLANYNYVSTTTNIDGIHEYQKATYSGAENFDYYDFKPYTWYQDGNTYKVGPLIKFFADERTATWHNNFANPFVYDEIQWLKSKKLWSSDIQFENAKNELLSTKLVEVETNSAQPNIVDVAQIGFSGSSSSSTGTSGYNIPGISGTSTGLGGLQSSLAQSGSPTLIIKYNHGLIIPNDFLNLKTRAAVILSIPYLYSNLNSSERNKLNLISNRNYQIMLRGNYPLKYGYNYRGCLGIDQPITTFNKSFVY